MSVYMTEEEQLQAIKNWWQRHSNIILTIASILLLLAAAYRYWHWHQDKEKAFASTAYEQMMVAFSNKDNKSVRSYANQLIQNYPKTVYSDVSHLILSKLFIAKDKYPQAQAELSKVIAESKMPALKQIAKIRLARILAMNKAWSEALKLLENIDDPAYLLMVHELQGDIYVLTGAYQKAVESYNLAINDAKSSNVGDTFLEMKINELAAIDKTEDKTLNPSQDAGSENK